MTQGLNAGRPSEGMKYEFNLEKLNSSAGEIRKDLPFWSPNNNFVGVVEFTTEQRVIKKNGNMPGDLTVANAKIISGFENLENAGDGKPGKKEYRDEEVTFKFDKTVLQRNIPKFSPLTGKKLLIKGEGKKQGNHGQYDSYLIMEEQHAIQEGYISLK